MMNKTINFIMVNIIYKIDRIWIHAAGTMKEIGRKRMMEEICFFSQLKVERISSSIRVFNWGSLDITLKVP